MKNRNPTFEGTLLATCSALADIDGVRINLNRIGYKNESNNFPERIFVSYRSPQMITSSFLSNETDIMMYDFLKKIQEAKVIPDYFNITLDNNGRYPGTLGIEIAGLHVKYDSGKSCYSYGEQPNEELDKIIRKKLRNIGLKKVKNTGFV